VQGDVGPQGPTSEDHQAATSRVWSAWCWHLRRSAYLCELPAREAAAPVVAYVGHHVRVRPTDAEHHDLQRHSGRCARREEGKAACARSSESDSEVLATTSQDHPRVAPVHWPGREPVPGVVHDRRLGTGPRVLLQAQVVSTQQPDRCRLLWFSGIRWNYLLRW